MEVGFARSALLRFGAVTVLLLLASVVALVVDPAPPRAPLPAWVRLPIGGLGLVIGARLAHTALERWRSDDPAIRVDDAGAFFHMNPGRRVLLRRDEIIEVREVRETTRGPQRYVLGGTYFDVATSRPERFWSSRILVAERFVDDDLETVRARLVIALS